MSVQHSGEPPHQRGSDTSAAAAAAITPHVGTLLATVLDAFHGATHGLTDEECQRLLELEGSTQRPRRVELVRRGLVVDSGTRRRTSAGRSAVVWRAA